MNVNIFLTTDCNLNCRHCGIDRSIRGESMDQELLERLFSDLKEPDFQEIAITGGEPLIQAEKLTSSLKKTGLGKEKTVKIFTNGMWARDYREAKEMIKELESAGVSRLLLSTDEFHREFVPLEYIANAIRASEDSSIEIGINMVSFRSTFKKDRKSVYKLAKMLGKEVKTVYRPVNLIKMAKYQRLSRVWPVLRAFLRYSPKKCLGMFYVLDDGSEELFIDQIWGTLEGNAKQNLREKDLMIRMYKIPAKKEILSKIREIKCESMEITVMPDGTLLPCCSFEMLNAYKDLKLGKYPETDLESFRKNLETPPLSFLYSRKWKYLDEYIQGDGLFFECARVDGVSVLDLCDLCTEVHRSYSNKNFIEKTKI